MVALDAIQCYCAMIVVHITEPRRLHEQWAPGGAFRLSIMPVKGRRTEIPKRTTDLSNFIHRLSFVHLRDYTNLRVAGPWGERSALEG